MDTINTREFTDEVWVYIEKTLADRDTILAQQVRELFPTVVARNVRDMDTFNALSLQSGDIVICNKSDEAAEGRRDQEIPWLLLSKEGQCMLMGEHQTESVEWFFRFGSIDIVRTQPEKL